MGTQYGLILARYNFQDFMEMEKKNEYTELRKKHRTKKYNSQFSLHLYNEIVYIYNDKILVQR